MNLPLDLVDKVRTASQVAVLTGAGISAESGVPTFRDAQTGLWSKYDPQELATPTAFIRDSKLVWDWYNFRRELIGNAMPNAGHTVLARFEDYFDIFTLITQNVDGLHQRAGSKAIIELHGNITRARCWAAGHIVESWDNQNEHPPTCPRCGSILRPDVVWYGESLPHQALSQALEAATNCNIFFSIGTSALVHPAASLADVATQNGACLIEINVEPTPLTPETDYFLQGPAGILLPQLEKDLVDSQQTI